MAEGFLIEQIHILLGNATHCGKRYRSVRIRAMRLKEWGRVVMQVGQVNQRFKRNDLKYGSR